MTLSMFFFLFLKENLFRCGSRIPNEWAYCKKSAQQRITPEWKPFLPDSCGVQDAQPGQTLRHPPRPAKTPASSPPSHLPRRERDAPLKCFWVVFFCSDATTMHAWKMADALVWPVRILQESLSVPLSTLTILERLSLWAFCGLLSGLLE